MKICKKCNVEKSLADFYADKKGKLGRQAACKDCCRLYEQSRYAINKDAYKARAALRRKLKPEECAASVKDWVNKNQERRKEIARDYARRNKNKMKARSRLWLQNNLHKHAAKEAKRRAMKLQATPSWADLAKIEQVYKSCPKGYHVDHIIPLKGKNVCGLHVHYNLQHLPAIDNIRKSNKVSYDR